MWSRYDRHFVGITWRNAFGLNGEYLSCYSNKIESVTLRKCPCGHRLTNKLYLSAITVTNISQSFTYKMAAKINWHRYGTKYVTVTLCILKVGNIYLTTVLQSACLSVCLSARVSQKPRVQAARKEKTFLRVQQTTLIIIWQPKVWLVGVSVR